MYPITKMHFAGISSFVENTATNEIYINGRAHDAVTLTPKFDDYVKYDNTAAFCAINGFQLSKSFRCGAVYLRDYSIMSCQGHYPIVGPSLVVSDAFEYSNNTKQIHQANTNYRSTIEKTPFNSSIDCITRTVWNNPANSNHYALYDRSEAANPGSYAGMYNVDALTQTGTLNVGFGAHATCTMLYEDSTAIYFVYASGHTGAGAGKVTVAKFLKSTQAITALVSLDNAGAASGYSPMQSFTPPITVGTNIFMLVAEGTNNGILLIKFDKTNGTATITRKTVSFTANGGSNPFVDSGIAVGTNARWRTVRTQILLINGGTHFATLTCRNNTDATNVPADTYYQLNVFEIPSGNWEAASYTYKSKIVLSGGLTPFGMLDLTDKLGTKIAVACAGDVRTYTFDAGTATYTLTNTFSVVTRSMGVDSLGRLWIMADGSAPQLVYMIAPGKTVRVNIAPQSSSYSYTGSPISTNLVVSAIDDNGAKVAKNISLTVERGNVTFTGGATSVNITTSAGADLNVPITITGGGQFSIVATEIL